VLTSYSTPATLTLIGVAIHLSCVQSNDFSILPRYSGFLWETDWVQHNGVFAWHINTSQEVLAKVNEISNLTVDVILEEIEKGNILLKTIRIEE
jgi:hypothetical protein